MSPETMQWIEDPETQAVIRYWIQTEPPERIAAFIRALGEIVVRASRQEKPLVTLR